MKSKLHRPLLTPRFERALLFATRQHAKQLKKGTTVPYIAHLLGVASLVLDSGGDEDLAIAGLLHDVVEDCGGLPMLKQVRRRFGNRVADIVDGCSDYRGPSGSPKPPWHERKEAYLRHLRTANSDVRLVSAADKLHNSRQILADYREIGDKVFDRFTGKREGTLWYYDALLKEFLRTKPNRLVSEFGRVVSELESLTRKPEKRLKSKAARRK
jgi:(p)ppGpp synthase/HD superfamily hydrolase